MSAPRVLTRGFRTVEVAAARRRVKTPYSRACRALSPTGTVPGSGIGAGRDDAMKITTAYATVANQRTTALPLRIRSLALRSRTRRLELRAALRASLGVRRDVGPAIRAHEPGFARRLDPLAAGRAGARGWAPVASLLPEVEFVPSTENKKKYTPSPTVRFVSYPFPSATFVSVA